MQAVLAASVRMLHDSPPGSNMLGPHSLPAAMSICTGGATTSAGWCAGGIGGSEYYLRTTVDAVIYQTIIDARKSVIGG